MKTILYSLTLAGVSALFAHCTSPDEKDAKASEAQATARNTDTARGSSCDITLGNVHFTRSINGADTLAVEQQPGKIRFTAGEKKDYFNDPDGKLSNNTAPILLSRVDNTKPFTLTAKVTPSFTPEGTYNAGVLYIYANDNLYQKQCFEQDERGKHRMVTVRTKGTSDDNNHDIIEQPFVYMKISSDTKTVASYYSLDNKNWQMVRLYQNDYPKEIWVGISTQCPVARGTTAYFEALSLVDKSVTDFRLGN